MGIAERRERDAKQMKTRILDTAMKLFLENGFENVTIRRIAAKIEYSPATIYLYYKDKNDILYALHSNGFEMLHERQLKVVAMRNPWKRLREHGRLYLSFALENPEYYDLMFIMRGPAKKIKEKEKWESGLRSYNLLKENVRQCMDAGYLNKGNPDVASLAFWSLTHGLASLVIRKRCIMFPEDQIEHIIEQARNYIMDNFMESEV
ncbi:MAG: TetR/AcrR family transcriptional regulator [Dissulfurispiraceae bacterium]|jgi:AcrR family transcriptional regulator